MVNFKEHFMKSFYLTNSMSAAMYEIKLKNNVLQRELFTYISGGTKSPKFLTDKHFIEKNRKLDIEFIKLNKFYKKADNLLIKKLKFLLMIIQKN